MPLVLVIDDDADVRLTITMTLQLGGYETAEAGDGASGIATAQSLQPDLILLDVMMPVMDGLEVARRIRADVRLAQIPVIMLTARAQVLDKVDGLATGVDDYITKPFDNTELLARVHATLRRTALARSVSPLTGLPGNISIEQEIARRHAAGVPVALLYADINDFKAYNDHYGFLRGDDVIRTLAQVLRQVTAELAGPETFVGHIGGDDFVVLTDPERATEVAEAVAAEFDAAVPALYDPEDVAAGAIEVADRRGLTHRFPLVTLSVGIATTALRQFEDHRELVAVASEMKQHAKQARGDGSNAAVDRRGSGDGAASLDGVEAVT